MSHEIVSPEKRKVMEAARQKLAKLGITVAPSTTATHMAEVISREMAWTPRRDPMVLIERMAQHKPGKRAKSRDTVAFRFRPLQVSPEMRQQYERCKTPRQITIAGGHK